MQKVESKDSSKAVALFVRHPVPGCVKTRLARHLGNKSACDLYKAMVADVIANIKASRLPIILFHDGTDAAGLPEEWLTVADKVFEQQGVTIGERMAAAFERLFAEGVQQVLLVGSDIPGIDVQLLQSAVEAIGNHAVDVAIAPAFDGGYCLISFRMETFDCRLFRGISWSTSSVLSETMELCDDYGLKLKLLESRQDIDTIDDLWAYNASSCKYSPATNAWLAAWLPLFSTQKSTAPALPRRCR